MISDRHDHEEGLHRRCRAPQIERRGKQVGLLHPERGKRLAQLLEPLAGFSGLLGSDPRLAEDRGRLSDIDPQIEPRDESRRLVDKRRHYGRLPREFFLSTSRDRQKANEREKRTET